MTKDEYNSLPEYITTAEMEAKTIYRSGAISKGMGMLIQYNKSNRISAMKVAISDADDIPDCIVDLGDLK